MIVISVYWASSKQKRWASNWNRAQDDMLHIGAIMSEHHYFWLTILILFSELALMSDILFNSAINLAKHWGLFQVIAWCLTDFKQF